MLPPVAALLVGLVAHVAAHPVTSPNPSPIQPRAIDVSRFRLKTTAVYNSTEETGDISIKLLKRDSYVDTAMELVKKVVPGATFRLVTDYYVGTNGVAHVNFKQTANGLDIDNADFNVNVSSARRNQPRSTNSWLRLARTAPFSPTGTLSIQEIFRLPLQSPKETMLIRSRRSKA